MNTVTQFNGTPLADKTLEMIRSASTPVALVSPQLLDDAKPWKEAVDELAYLLAGQPRLGPGREEWQRTQPRAIVTRKHGRA